MRVRIDSSHSGQRIIDIGSVILQDIADHLAKFEELYSGQPTKKDDLRMAWRTVLNRLQKKHRLKVNKLSTADLSGWQSWAAAQCAERVES